MSTIDNLLNDAESAKLLQKAKQEGQIEYARKLVHLSLPPEIWEVFGIDENTPRTRINVMDHPQIARYTLDGNVNIILQDKTIAVPFDFEIAIGNDALPSVIFAYVSQGTGRAKHLPKNWSSPPSKKLHSARDINQNIESIHASNKGLISQMLLEVKNQLVTLS